MARHHAPPAPPADERSDSAKRHAPYARRIKGRHRPLCRHQRDESARWSHNALEAHPGQPDAAAMNASRGGSAARASKESARSGSVVREAGVAAG